MRSMKESRDLQMKEERDARIVELFRAQYQSSHSSVRRSIDKQLAPKMSQIQED